MENYKWARFYCSAFFTAPQVKMSKIPPLWYMFMWTHVNIVLQHEESDLYGSKPWQNRENADQTALQPGGHINAKSTSKTHTHTHVWLSFYPTVTHTCTLAHMLLSLHRGGSFYVSNFKHMHALAHRRTETSISSSYDKSESWNWGGGWCTVWGEGVGGAQIVSGESSDVPFRW